MAAEPIMVYINDELLINGCPVDSNYSVTSTGLRIMRNGNLKAEWTYSGSNQFLGFSTTQGATTAEYEVGSTGYLYDMQATYQGLRFYSVEMVSKLVDNIALNEFLTKSKQLFYYSSNPPPYPVTSVNGQSGAVTVTDSDEKVKHTDLNGTNSGKPVLLAATMLSNGNSRTETVYSSTKFMWNDYSPNLSIYNSDRSKYSSISATRIGLANSSTTYTGALSLSTLSSDRTYTLPNKSGTIALTTDIPTAVTESTVSGWGFTKNTGTYSKPSGGIPKTDLASAVQTSLEKADTALQSYTESDPVFTASAAHGIASTDITNWNNKISEPASEGTNGQVLMTNGNGTRTWGSVSTADEKIKLTSQSTSGNYPLIFGPTSITSNSTYQGYYNTGVTVNPNTKAITATTFIGALTGIASGNLTSSSTLDASKLSGEIPSGITATTQDNSDNSTKIATTAFVKTAINNLPEPMVFKGSLGTGGTITSLPAASTSNTGYTYKVITAGTYANQSAKIGDTFISDGSGWILIPSGDEPSGTVISINPGNGLLNGTGTSAITTSGTLNINYGTTTAKIGTTAPGSATTVSRSDHVHAIDLATGDANGQVKIAGTNVSVKGLGSNAYSSTAYLPLAGGTMTGPITFVGNQSSAFNNKGIIFTNGSRIGENSSNALGLYSGSTFYIRPDSATSSSGKGIEISSTTMYPTVTDEMSLGDSSHKWTTVYATTFSGNATTATTASKLGSSNLGSATKPIYLASGTATECSTYAGGTAVTLNNSSKAASTANFYAPTTGGTQNTQALIGDGATAAPKWVNISPSVTVTAGTASAAPKINVTVLGQSGTAQSITTATTGLYGVTKLNSATNSTSTSEAATPSAVKSAYDLANNHKYWADIEATSAATYNKAPEMATIKLNGNTSASAASTSNVTLVFDTVLQALNFVFA